MILYYYQFSLYQTKLPYKHLGVSQLGILIQTNHDKKLEGKADQLSCPVKAFVTVEVKHSASAV